MAGLHWLETFRTRKSLEHQEFVDLFHQAREYVLKINRCLKEARNEVKSITEKRNALALDQQQLLKAKIELEYTSHDLAEDLERAKSAKERDQRILEKIDQTIAEKQTFLDSITASLSEARRREGQCSRGLASLQRQRADLYARCGRALRFATKQERDEWINKEIKYLQGQISEGELQEADLKDKLESDAARLRGLGTRLGDVTGEAESLRLALRSLADSRRRCIRRKDAANNLKNELWDKEAQLNQKLSAVKDKLAKEEHNLCSMIGKSIAAGTESVRKVLAAMDSQQEGGQDVLSGYYGPVVDHFQCPDFLYNAIEVAAGNKLFNHIVESERVSTIILNEMNKQNLPGEVFFMPLNRLRIHDKIYPQDNDVIPMVSKLQYEPKFEPAMKFIFNSTLISRTLQTATDYAKRFNLDCVTLQGDKVTRYGVLSGGFFNEFRSRLKSYKACAELAGQVQEFEKDLEMLHDELIRTDGTISGVVSELQKLDLKEEKARDILDKLNADCRLLREQISELQEQAGPARHRLDACRAELAGLRAAERGLHDELEQDLSNKLSVSDQAKLETLSADIAKLTNKSKEAFKNRMELEEAKAKTEHYLTNNLIRQKEELMVAIQEYQLEDKRRVLADCTADMAALDVKLGQLNIQLAEIDNKIEEAETREKELKLELELRRTNEKEAQDKMEQDQLELQKLDRAEEQLRDHLHEGAGKAALLPPPPNEPRLSATYEKMSLNQLSGEMETVKHHMNRFNDINRRALYMHNVLSGKIEKISKKRDVLLIDQDNIKDSCELVDHHQQGMSALTFRQVSCNFSHMFQRLVVRGRGQLVLQQAAGEFTNVDFKVSFSCNEEDVKDIKQLSGGQKTVVALTFIFALQKCDPAPFYLLDEIDQALDEDHRREVARLVAEMSASAQFIVSTFRPELLEAGHKFYAVSYEGGRSHVAGVSRDRAAAYVEASPEPILRRKA